MIKIILLSVVILLVLGLIFGIILALGEKFLKVKQDQRIIDVENLLPGYNCGACGTPGCNAFATAIVSGEAGNLSRCKPGKVDKNYNPILEYLKDHPNEDGSLVKVEI